MNNHVIGEIDIVEVSINKVTSSNIQYSKHLLPSGETWESFTYANYIYQGSIK